MSFIQDNLFPHLSFVPDVVGLSPYLWCFVVSFTSSHYIDHFFLNAFNYFSILFLAERRWVRPSQVEGVWQHDGGLQKLANWSKSVDCARNWQGRSGEVSRGGGLSWPDYEHVPTIWKVSDASWTWPWWRDPGVVCRTYWKVLVLAQEPWYIGS